MTEERTRKAVDTVARFHFDRHGNRIWREARQLRESEHGVVHFKQQRLSAGLGSSL
ncbi:hypothetical protein [Streptomyces antimycoticus]|uniref:hypothetical protein n=1 Tax=Streptomyces antimycoticus TaxID=68175 RepID=UPI001374FDD6|nr:hypothetical protein [Streptomyces antimycoticus]